eukprot:535908-Prymnesium_polylepis.1
MQGSTCEQPLFGSYVRIHTAVGVIWLDGDIVTFEDGMKSVFTGAGFQVGGQGHRRLATAFDLMGIFNMIPSFVGWNSSYDAPPKIPTTFTADVTLLHACPAQDLREVDHTLCQNEDLVSTINGIKFVSTKLSLQADSGQAKGWCANGTQRWLALLGGHSRSSTSQRVALRTSLRSGTQPASTTTAVSTLLKRLGSPTTRKRPTQTCRRSCSPCSSVCASHHTQSPESVADTDRMTCMLFTVAPDSHTAVRCAQ